MTRFALFLVAFGALVVLCASASRREGTSDSAASDSEENSEIISYGEATGERRRREAPKTENSDSQFIQSEKATKGDNIIWRDNSETKKQGHVPTVTRVLYHGIYPTLNITEPLNGSHVGKYRQKRAVVQGSNSKLTSSSTRTVSTNGLGSRQSEGRGATSEWLKTTDNMVEAMQQYNQPHETQPPYPSPAYQDRKKPVSGNHYQQADHSSNTLNNAYLSLDTSVPKNYSQGSIKYRTMYFPPSEYQGDPENKGRVKLISVGYYSINESTADLRSYRNPKVDRHIRNTIPTYRRMKRDTHWLDKFFKSIWVMRSPETSEEENEIPRSEPLKMEVSEVNGDAQDVYGYSSNGHGHPHNVDMIYLVQNDRIQNLDQSGNPKPQPTPHQPVTSTTVSSRTSMEQTTPTTTTEPEEILLPADQPVLIQAPPRKIVCRPPKRLARGRCRTVW